MRLSSRNQPFLTTPSITAPGLQLYTFHSGIVIPCRGICPPRRSALNLLLIAFRCLYAEYHMPVSASRAISISGSSAESVGKPSGLPKVRFEELHPFYRSHNDLRGYVKVPTGGTSSLAGS